MKKLFVLATLLAALASFGCGSDEPSADAPAKAPNASAKKDIVKTEKLSDGSIVETTKRGTTIITHPDGTKTYKSGTGPKIEAKPGDTIHHFSK